MNAITVDGVTGSKTKAATAAIDDGEFRTLVAMAKGSIRWAHVVDDSLPLGITTGHALWSLRPTTYHRRST